MTAIHLGDGDGDGTLGCVSVECLPHRHNINTWIPQQSSACYVRRKDGIIGVVVVIGIAL